MNTCSVCPNHCNLNNKTICSNKPDIEDGELIHTTAIAIDPIEKKPLYHFQPGTKTLSIGTLGCSLHCLNCQNSSIALPTPDTYVPITTYKPQDIINQALYNDLTSISWTYNEPTIHPYWIINTAKLAKEHDIKTILVTNGYNTQETREKLVNYVDAVNVDIKSMSDEFYKTVCHGRLEPVLDSVKFYVENDIHTEITNLVIPGYNDDRESLNKLIEFILSLSDKIPLHFSKFFPMYKLMDVNPTDDKKIEKACDLAKHRGLKYVYPGNIPSSYLNNTYCQNCRHLLIERKGYSVKNLVTSQNACPTCNHITDFKK